MGHLINPISYRLGKSKYWNSLWFNHKNSVFFSSLLKSDWVYFLFFKRLFMLRFFQSNSLIFSHVKILRSLSNIICSIYFFDGSFLQKYSRIERLFSTNNFFLLFSKQIIFLSFFFSLKILKNKQSLKIFYSNFLSNRIYFIYNLKRKIFLLKMYFKNKFINYFYSYLEKILTIFFFNYLKKKDLFYFFFFLSVKKFIKNKNFFLNLFFVKNLFFNKFFEQLKLFLRVKIIIFRIKVIFFNYLKNSKNLYNFNYLRKRLSFRLFIIRSFSESIKNYSVVIRIMTGKIFVLNNIKESWYSIFLRGFDKFLNIKFIWKQLDKNEFNSSIISCYLANRFKLRFRLNEVLKPLTNFLLQNTFVLGFKISCAGRFTRNEIATYKIKKFSSVPYSKIFSLLDFSLSEVILKYSICGIKVWLHKRRVYKLNKFRALFNNIYKFENEKIRRNFYEFRKLLKKKNRIYKTFYIKFYRYKKLYFHYFINYLKEKKIYKKKIFLLNVFYKFFRFSLFFLKKINFFFFFKLKNNRINNILNSPNTYRFLLKKKKKLFI